MSDAGEGVGKESALGVGLGLLSLWSVWSLLDAGGVAGGVARPVGGGRVGCCVCVDCVVGVLRDERDLGREAVQSGILEWTRLAIVVVDRIGSDGTWNEVVVRE